MCVSQHTHKSVCVVMLREKSDVTAVYMEWKIRAGGAPLNKCMQMKQNS